MQVQHLPNGATYLPEHNVTLPPSIKLQPVPLRSNGFWLALAAIVMAGIVAMCAIMMYATMTLQAAGKA